MNRFWNRSANLLLLALFTLSVTGLMADSFGYTVHGSLYLWLAGICVSVWISAHFRRGLLLGLPLSALLLYAACRHYGGSLPGQLVDALDMAVAAYRQRFGTASGTVDYVGVLSDKSHDLVLLFLAFLLASTLSTGISSHRWRVFFSLAGSLPPFAFCIAVNGDPPVWAVAGLLLFWALLLVGGDRYDASGARGRSVFAAALPSLLLLGLLLGPLGPAGYDLTQEDIARSRRFDRVMDFVRRILDSPQDFPLPGVSLPPVTLRPEAAAPDHTEEPAGELPEEGIFSDGGGMDLTQGYDFSASGQPVLQLESDAGGALYLRGLSYGDYTGTGWAAAPEPELPSSLPYAAQAAARAGGQEHSADIRLYGSGSLALLPYYCAQAGESDLYVPLAGGGSYQAAFYTLSADPSAILPEADPEELAYRSYAQTVYTRLPESTLAWARELLAEEGLAAGTPQLVRRVAEYVRNAATYDLSVGAFASDDYARAFLTEARRGYCVHYATAAAVLYRALGIPARVTEGYLCHPVPGQVLEVTGADAHAWVEVYYDGFGWVPVEVTGRSGLPAEEAEEASSPSPPPSAAPEPGAATEPPQASSAPTRSPVQEPSVGIIGRESAAETAESASRFPWRAVGRALAWALAGALIIAALPLQRALRLRLRRRRFTQEDCGKAAVAIWRAAKRLPPAGREIPEELTACAEKAAFSQHRISPAERDACLALYEGMVYELSARSGPLKRLWYRYGKCIM